MLEKETRACGCHAWLQVLDSEKNPSLTLSKQALVFTCLQDWSFENTAGKGEIACNEQFLLFRQCFLPVLENFLPLSLNLKLSSADSFNLANPK